MSPERCAACGKPITSLRVEVTLRVKGKPTGQAVYCSLSCPIIRAKRRDKATVAAPIATYTLTLQRDPA